MDSKIRIERCTHFFSFQLSDVRLYRAIQPFLESVTDYEEKVDPITKRQGHVPRLWGSKIGTQLRFAIGAYTSFQACLNVNSPVHLKTVDVSDRPLYTPASQSFTLSPSFVLRDYQLEAIRYSLGVKESGKNTVLISKPPGTGKTVTFCAFACELKLRAGIITRATYCSKWVGDVKELLGLADDQIYEMSGSASITKAVKLARAGEFNYAFTVISLDTMGAFIGDFSSCQESTEEKYGCKPDELMKILEIGLLGGDEVHERFHMLTTMMCHLHGPFFVGLSATLKSREEFRDRIQKLVFPSHIRFSNIKPLKCAQMFNVDYYIDPKHKSLIRTTNRGKPQYSQSAYEKSIYKNATLRNNFLDMVEHGVKTYFFHNTHQPNDKLAIYFNRVEMIEHVLGRLKTKYPDYDIRKFTAGDPYGNITEPKIRITTQGSGGTGKDIRGLTTVLTFNNLNSLEGNEQLLGRIRAINGREDLYFVQYNCAQIPKHQKYKHTRNKDLKDKVKGITQKYYQPPL